ncbi:MAG: DUF4097 family beta strand repeat protein [Bacteriovoracaceae bacterium]|nr:DUF4097 family beta strand repeat protein [Bacteriovoracaceae bacterium]
MPSFLQYAGVILGVGFLTTAMAAPSGLQSPETKFPASKIKEVEIYKLTGNIEIFASPQNEAWIEKSGTECKTEIALEQNTLTVRELDGSSDLNCPHPLKAYIPAQAALRLNSNAANVTAQGLRGSVDLELGSGNSTFKESGGSIRAYVNSGDVRLENFAGRAHMRTKSGNITISMEQAAAGNQLNLETRSGNVQVQLPPGLEAVTNLKTTSGHITDDYGPDKNKQHPLRVRVQTQSGNVAVQKMVL